MCERHIVAQAHAHDLAGVHVIIIIIRVWSFWNHFFFWGSLAFYFLFLCIYTLIPVGTPSYYYSVFEMFSRPTYWLLLLLVPTACIMIDILVAQYVHTPPCPSRSAHG